MDTTEKCTQLMDFSVCWADWRNGLKQSVKSSHTYYQDESVQLMKNSLDSLLSRRVCESSPEEQLLVAMWDAANPRERETLAGILLKISDQI